MRYDKVYLEDELSKQEELNHNTVHNHYRPTPCPLQLISETA